MTPRPILTALLLAASLSLLPGCQSAYYGTLEKFGVHKREILVDRVEEAKESQERARDQFASALERFRSVVTLPDTPLQEKYDTLRTVLERSEARAAEVRERIAAVEEVAGALFEEWEEELDDYASASLRRSSAAKLRATRERYGQMLAAMRRAEARIEPVLVPLRDQVLFLKHNLNAQAVASLRSELAAIESDVDRLLREMAQAIAEAEVFLRSMEQA